MRSERLAEVYSLTCHACGRDVDLPARDGPARCPRCGLQIAMDWSGSKRDYDDVRDGRERYDDGRPWARTGRVGRIPF